MTDWLNPRRVIPPEEIERGLRLIMYDGVTAQVMTTLTGGAFLVAFALLLGAPPLYWRHRRVAAADPAAANSDHLSGGAHRLPQAACGDRAYHLAPVLFLARRASLARTRSLSPPRPHRGAAPLLRLRHHLRRRLEPLAARLDS